MSSQEFISFISNLEYYRYFKGCYIKVRIYTTRTQDMLGIRVSFDVEKWLRTRRGAISSKTFNLDGNISTLDDSIERAIEELGISKNEETHLQKWILNYHYGFDILSSEKVILNVSSKEQEGILMISDEESDASVKFNGITLTFANMHVALNALVEKGVLCSPAESYSSLKKKVEDLQSEVRAYMELRDAQCTLSRNTSFLRYIDDTEFFEDIDLELESMLDNILHLIPDLL